jgi:hypothetical protein
VFRWGGARFGGSLLDPLGSWFDPVAKPVNKLTDDVSKTLGNILAAVPGESEVAKAVTALVNGPLKDFANTAVGKVFLTALGTSLYMGLAAYQGAGAALVNALAPAAFATPGVARGDDFDQAWIDGFIDRVKRTGEILATMGTGEIASEAANYVPDVVTQATTAANEVKAGLDGLVATYGPIAQSLGAPATIDQIAQSLGISQWAAATAKSIYTGVGVCDPFPDCLAEQYDPLTGQRVGVAGSLEGSLSARLSAYGVQSAQRTYQNVTQQAPANFVSSSALKFMASSLKPYLNNLASPASLASIMNNVSSRATGGDAGAQEEAAQLAKAKRALDRQNWVEWYKRASAVGLV